MPIYTITGANRQTGADAALTIEADSIVEAEQLANKQGVMVADCQEVRVVRSAITPKNISDKRSPTEEVRSGPPPQSTSTPTNHYEQTGSQYGAAVRTTDSVARAEVEHEAMMTGVLAVLLSVIPFATIISAVAGASRWHVAHKSWGGNAGRFATLWSLASIIIWTIVIAVFA